MKNMKIVAKEQLLKSIAKVAYLTAQENANTACVYWHYQPQLPDAVKKLRKF
jgi:AgrD protein